MTLFNTVYYSASIISPWAVDPVTVPTLDEMDRSWFIIVRSLHMMYQAAPITRQYHSRW